eukprot:1161734-Pelagomonas_calceolata.AAC.17
MSPMLSSSSSTSDVMVMLLVEVSKVTLAGAACVRVCMHACQGMSHQSAVSKVPSVTNDTAPGRRCPIPNHDQIEAKATCLPLRSASATLPSPDSILCPFFKSHINAHL